MNKLSKAQVFGLKVWMKSLEVSMVIGAIVPFVYEFAVDPDGWMGLITLLALPILTIIVGAFIGIIPFMVFTFIRLAIR